MTDRPLRRLSAAAALAAALAGCAMADRAPVPGVASTASSDASCRVIRRPPGPTIGAQPTFDLVCGQGRVLEDGVGSVLSVVDPVAPGAVDDARRRVEQAAVGSPIGRNLADRLACQPSEWLGIEASGFATGWRVGACSARVGGWPVVTVVVPTATGIVQGDVPPAALPDLPRILGGVTALPGWVPPGPEQTAQWARTSGDWVIRNFGAMASYDPADQELYRTRMLAGPIHNSQGDHAEAERVYREALAVQLRLLPPDHPGLIDTLVSLAVEISNQGRTEEAEPLFRRGEQIAQASTAEPALQGRLKSGRSLALANRGDFQGARRLSREAIDFHRRRATTFTQGELLTVVGDSSDYDLALALFHDSAMALRLRDVPGATASITEAIAVLDSNPALPTWWRPGFLMQASEVAEARREFDVAEQYLLTALDLRRRALGDTRPAASVHFALGRLYRGEGMLTEALASFRRGVRIIENDPLGRTELTIDRFGPYLNVLADLGAKSPADRARYEVEMFRASQLVQGSVAGETVSRATAQLAIGDPAVSALARGVVDLKRRRDAALLSISAEAAKPATQRDRKREVALVEEVRVTTVGIAETETQLRRAFPNFDRLTTPRAISEADVLARLAPSEALLSFTFGRTGGFAFLLHRGVVRSAPIDLDLEDLNLAVAALRRPFLTAGRGTVPAYDVQAAHALYRTLIGPFAAELATVRHLVMVPNGPLSALPPTLLVAEAPRPGPVDYRQVAWLGRDRALSVAPAVRAFVDMRAARDLPSAPRTFLGVGDPPFVGAAARGRVADGCQESGVMDAGLLRQLEPLPETGEEVRRAGRALGARPEDLMIGPGATEEAVRGRKLDDYRVLYFATHGLLPGELRCQAQPGLALAPPPVTGNRRERDGLLDASEIASLRLRADLVVLSACNTAGGGAGRFGGEALSGLAEAFFNAGARSLLVSHWQVPSAPTMDLMVGLFERVGGRLEGGLAEALRGAQDALRANPATAHPVFWAAFTLVGDGGLPLAEIQRQIAAAR